MSAFLEDETFLLPTETARRLYFTVAQTLPILDWHCHLSARDIAENAPCGNLTQLWLAHDHYKWRVMRACGVPESHVTGDASDEEKFAAWASVVPQLAGNPLYHWTHLELRRFFDIDTVLNPDTAREIYTRVHAQLATLTVRDLLRRANFSVICTTDNPDDSLKYHEQLQDEYTLGTFPTRVLPTLRVNGAAGDLSAVAARFAAQGCRSVDYSAPDFCDLDTLLPLAALCVKHDWVLQAHVGVARDVNPTLRTIGHDAGGDCIANTPNLVTSAATFLARAEAEKILPKTVLFSLNPADNAPLAALCGTFGDRVRQGSAWWFNDSLPGMRAQLTTWASMMPLNTFPGFVTDSRSFLSAPRHEYFRRLFCGLVGDWAESGQLPQDTAMLTRLVRDVCHDTANAFFGLA